VTGSDDNLESEAVFAGKNSLVAEFKPSSAPDGERMRRPDCGVRYTGLLNPAG